MMIRATVLLAVLLFAGGFSQPGEGGTRAGEPLPMAQPGALREGRGAIATRRVATGRPVGHMYRTTPINPLDSGWIFLAGDEPRLDLSDIHQLGIYDLDVILRHDPAIAPYLDAPVGSDFVRSGDRFVPSGHPPHE